MKSRLFVRRWRVVRNAMAAGLALILVVLMLPSPARSQLGLDPCCTIISAGLSTISNLLRSVVAKPLGTIQQLEQQSANFEQQVVFPIAAINQARGAGRQRNPHDSPAVGADSALAQPKRGAPNH